MPHWLYALFSAYAAPDPLIDLLVLLINSLLLFLYILFLWYGHAAGAIFLSSIHQVSPCFLQLPLDSTRLTSRFTSGFLQKRKKKRRKDLFHFVTSFLLLTCTVVLLYLAKKRRRKRKREKKKKRLWPDLCQIIHGWGGWKRKNLLVGHGSSLSVYHCLHTEFLIKLRYRVIRKDVGRGAWRCWKDRQHSNTPGNVVPFLNISIFGKEGGQNGVIRHG